MAYVLSTEKGVRTLKAGFKDWSVIWKRCRDVIAGSDKVKNAKTDYLPKLTNQTSLNYNAMLMRANFFNGTGRTVQAMLGMLFRKEPSMILPVSIEQYKDDITTDGTNFNVFVREITEEIVSVGRGGILVDCPPLPEGANVVTKANAEDLGLRPYMQFYCTESIINWKYRKINNKMQLSMVVLLEQVATKIDPQNPSQQQDEFAEFYETQYRVLDLEPDTNIYRIRMFRIDNRNQDELVGAPIYPLVDGSNMLEIPFTFLDSDGTDADFDEPPMLDLVDLNLSHYRTNADYEHGCHFTALPMLVISGMNPVDAKGQPVKIKVGSETALILDNPQAKAEYTEFTGTGLKTLESNLDRKQEMMGVLGARLLLPQKKAAETAMNNAINRVGENSVLASISIAVSLGIIQALTWFATWAGDAVGPDSIKFEINRDYLPVAIDGPTLTAYLGAYQAGTLRLEDIFDLFQRADLIDNEVEFKDFNEQVMKELADKQVNAIALAQATKPVVGNKPQDNGA